MIKILLVEDHELIRIGVRRLLQNVQEFKIVGEASTGEDAVHLARTLMPDVVLMDVQMPGMGGLEATRKIILHNSSIKILALTIYTHEPYPFHALKAGAIGYITKGCTVEEMIHAIRMAYTGQHYLSSDLAQRLALRGFGKTRESMLGKLSKRELQIMIMIISGQKIQDISIKLGLNPKTVNSYRYRIFEKLRINSDVEMTLLAIRMELIGKDKSTTESIKQIK
ncbi:MAG: uvrY [Gammaproteobacteria bacterium]|nr:uvrY [Gammaproteobacteria bacterium]